MAVSRRALLATVGTSLLGGCAGLGLGRRTRRRPPAPFLTEASDWEHPGYDGANTNAVPAHAAPNAPSESADWTVEFTASGVEDVAGPVVADGVAYLVFAGLDRLEEFERLVAVDIRTGEERWRVEARDSARARAPTVAGETVFWPVSTGEIRALHAADGTVRWTHAARNYARPYAAHGLVFTVGGTIREPVLEALDPHDGTPYWTRSEGERYWHPLAATDEAIYVTLEAATDSQRAELHALEPHTGETLWRRSTAAPRRAAVRPPYLLASAGRSDAQRLFALDLESRELAWSETVDLRRTATGRTVNGRQSIAAVTESRVLVHHDFHGSDHDRLECRELGSGAVRWTHTGNSDEPTAFNSPVVAGDGVYLTENRDRESGPPVSRLRVLDLRDGSERTRVTLPARSVGSPVVAAGRVILTTVSSGTAVSLSAR